MTVMAIKMFVGLICALAMITNVQLLSCCDFTSVYCPWASVSFQDYPSATPADLPLYYPYFLTTAPNYPTPEFLWLQDKAGSVDINDVITVPDSSAVFSFDYFFDTVYPPGGEYLHVFLVKSPLQKVLIASVTVTGDTWKHIDVPCDHNNDYCCGGLFDFPCSGTLEVDGYMQTARGIGLFAIDNIGICGPVVPTTTDRPTLPPPTPPTTCCDFEKNVCGFTTVPPNQWYWSPLLLPSVYVPPSKGYYIWSDNVGSSLYSGIASVTSSSLLSTDYYISDSSVRVEIYFDGLFLGILPYSSTWATNVVPCTGCCGGLKTCTGTVQMLIKSATPPFVVALDNTQVDGGCHDSIPCCYFSDPDICKFIIQPAPIPWQWSGISIPTNYVPTPRSEFMYFETTPSSGPGPLSAILRSPKLTIDSSTQFGGSFYVQTPPASTATDILNCNFYDLATGTSTTLDFIKDTSGAWYTTYSLSCISTHGNCCHGASSCSGYIEFEAQVDSLGGTLIYAIDAFEMGHVCPIPGLMMTSRSGNSSYIPLLPVL